MFKIRFNDNIDKILKKKWISCANYNDKSNFNEDSIKFE